MKCLRSVKDGGALSSTCHATVSHRILFCVSNTMNSIDATGYTTFRQVLLNLAGSISRDNSQPTVFSGATRMCEE